MFRLLVAAIFLSPISLWGLTFKIVGPCSSRPLFEREVSVKERKILGDVTIKTLNAYQIPYVGSEGGINSLYNSPTGLEALEVLSDRQMRAYGWCYRLNGEILEEMPDQVSVKNADVVEWYFAFSFLDGNDWSGQCTPAYLVKPDFMCE